MISSHSFKGSMIRSCYLVGFLRFFLLTNAFLLRTPDLPDASIRSTRLAVAPASSVPDDLTREELASRFVDVRDHYRQTNEMTQDDVCLSMLRTRLPDLHLNRCFLAPSTVEQAGQGLFANRDVEETEMITLYPGDALIQWGNGVGDFSSDVGVMFGNHVTGDSRDANRVTSNEARGYEIKIRDTHSMVGDPNLADYAAYLGHMINDGAALLSKNNACRTEYSRDTANRHNAELIVIEECHYAVIASKNIAKGEEIFISYGEDYWISRSSV
mmetsp:Transcript_29414/g.62451  ORF Transcript_29414/g.62451 Transcript_29414/m.62451 type:complete len:271 (+) Transcript_29414:56-868(+)